MFEEALGLVEFIAMPWWMGLCVRSTWLDTFEVLFIKFTRGVIMV